MDCTLQVVAGLLQEDRTLAQKHVDVEIPALLLMGSPALYPRKHYQFQAEDKMETMSAVVLYAIAHPECVLMVHVSVDADLFSDDHYLFLQYVTHARKLCVAKDVLEPSGRVAVFMENPFAVVNSWTSVSVSKDLKTVGMLLGCNGSPYHNTLYKAGLTCTFEIDSVSCFEK